MADAHRTKRPRTANWEVYDLFDSGYRLVSNTVPGLFSTISARVKGGLVNSSAIEFLRSKVRFERDEECWTAWRYLGGGGYGTAAVWLKTNIKGEVLDELVVKEQRDHHREGLWRDLEDLPGEAVLQQALNQSGCENIVQLRGFKAYNKPTRRWRFYLEYAPHGNLNVLRWRYRAFNRYLPELFLWHLFSSLAQAVDAMETDALTGDNIGGLQRHENDFILHLDIKPENIFLGYEETGAQRCPEEPWRTGGLIEPLYPSVKIGDFGLAQYSYEGDDQDVPDPAANPRGLVWQGTPGFKAPEQICYDHNWQTRQINHEDKITGKLNVWNIGKVMFDLCSLAQPHEYEHNMRAQTEEQFQANGNDTLPDFDTRPFATDKLCPRSPYSEELTGLIRNCMRMRPSDRPAAQQLALDTKAILLRKCGEAESRKPYNVRNRKLYYRRSEINYMRRNEKNCDLPNSAHHYLALLRPENNDPDEPQLNLDPVKLIFQRTGKDWGNIPQGDYSRGLIDENLEAKMLEKERYAWRDKFLKSGALKIENGKIFFLGEYNDLRRFPPDAVHDGHGGGGGSPSVIVVSSQRADGPRGPNFEQPQYLLQIPNRPIQFPNAKAFFCAHQSDRLRGVGYPCPHIEACAEDQWNEASPELIQVWNNYFARHQREYCPHLMVYEAFDIYYGQRYNQHHMYGFSDADIINIVLDEWNSLTNADRTGFVRQHIQNAAEQQYAERRRREIQKSSQPS